MSNRLDQEREARLQPARIKSCLEKLTSLGFEVESDGYTKLTFKHQGNTVLFWPYSGWFSGSGIGSGRGFEKLLKRLSDGS